MKRSYASGAKKRKEKKKKGETMQKILTQTRNLDSFLTWYGWLFPAFHLNTRFKIEKILYLC